jgi:hypothetical protein
MFLGNDDFGAIAEAVSSSGDMLYPYYVILFWACHVSAMLVTVMTVVTVFSKKLAAAIKRGFTIRKKRYIIFGVNSKSLCFAGNVLNNYKTGKPLVIFIDEYTDDQSRSALQRIGAVFLDEVVFQETEINARALKKAGLYRSAVYVFAFFESDVINYNIACGVWDAAKKKHVSCDRLKGIYISAGSDTVIDNLIKKRENVQAAYRYSMGCFSEGDLAARKLFDVLPVYRRLEFNNATGIVIPESAYTVPAISIIVLGFGEIGQHVLQQAILTSQFKGSSFYATIFDRNADSIKGAFIRRYSGLFDRNCPNKIRIDICQGAVGGEAFFIQLDEIIRRTGRIDYIISCLGDNDQNIEVITSLNRLFETGRFNCGRLPVFAAHVTEQKYHTFESDVHEAGKINVFGSYVDIYNENTIICEEMDILAKAMNSTYVRKHQKDKIEGLADDEIPAFFKDEWDKLSLHFKNSNRAGAAFIKAQLYILGLDLVRGDPDGKLRREDFIKLLDEHIYPERLSIMGETEHLRWNAFHFATGWIKKPICELTDHKSRIDEERKMHACLVTWDELVSISEKTKRNYQETDMENIIMIFDMIEEYNHDERIIEGNKLKYSIVRRI